MIEHQEKQGIKEGIGLKNISGEIVTQCEKTILAFFDPEYLATFQSFMDSGTWSARSEVLYLSQIVVTHRAWNIFGCIPINNVQMSENFQVEQTYDL